MNHSSHEPNQTEPMGREGLLAELGEVIFSFQRTTIPRQFPSGMANLTGQQYVVLHTLAASGPTSLSVIADSLGTGLPAVSGMVDRLEQAGLVVRERDDGDRRVTKAVLTDAGRELLREAASHMHHMFREVFSVLSEDELRELIRLFRILSGALERTP